VNAKRNTIQRQLIFDAVRDLNAHATAEQVYAFVAGKHPSISRATVYRNLSLMADSDELVNIGCYHGAARYDHNCHRHSHFVCEECERVFDVNEPFPEIDRPFDDMDGFVIRGHTLSFHGLCRECNDGRDT